MSFNYFPVKVESRAVIAENAMREQKIAIDEVVRTIETTSKTIQSNSESTDYLRKNAEELGIFAVELQQKFEIH